MIRDELAEQIVRGLLPPGVALEESELARRFGVSRTPVREAIRQLEATGFAEARPRRGAVVAKISSQRLREMFTVMAELEALCAAEAAVAMSADEQRGLERVHEGSRQAMLSSDIDAYREANKRFHDSIYAGTHNGFLGELTSWVRLRLEPFRRVQFRSSGRLAESFAEHERVVTAILKGDREGAATAMRVHLRTVHVVFDAMPAVEPASDWPRMA
jgi:DNA-binding GntR family transcriptional regulator